MGSSINFFSSAVVSLRVKGGSYSLSDQSIISNSDEALIEIRGSPVESLVSEGSISSSVAVSSILSMLSVHLLLDKVFPSSAVIKCRMVNSLVWRAQANQISSWPSLTSTQCMVPPPTGVNICRITSNGLYSYQGPSS